jgi:hypothetical protein
MSDVRQVGRVAATVAAVVSLVITEVVAVATQAGAEARTVTEEHSSSVGCEGTTTAGEMFNVFVQQERGEPTGFADLSVDRGHGLYWSTTDATVSGGAFDARFELTADDGTSLGAGTISGTYTPQGEPIDDVSRFHFQNSVMKSHLVFQDNAVTVTSMSGGDAFDVADVSCVGETIDVRQQWSDPHRGIFRGEEVRLGGECAQDPVVQADVWSTEDGYLLFLRTDETVGYGFVELGGNTSNGSLTWYDPETGDPAADRSTAVSMVQDGSPRTTTTADGHSTTVTRVTPQRFTLQTALLDGSGYSVSCGAEKVRHFMSSDIGTHE